MLPAQQPNPQSFTHTQTHTYSTALAPLQVDPEATLRGQLHPWFSFGVFVNVGSCSTLLARTHLSQTNRTNCSFSTAGNLFYLTKTMLNSKASTCKRPALNVWKSYSHFYINLKSFDSILLPQRRLQMWICISEKGFYICLNIQCQNIDVQGGCNNAWKQRVGRQKKRKTLKIQLKSKEMKCQVKCYFSFKQFNSYKLEMHKGGENLPRSASSYFFPPIRGSHF